MEKEDYTKLTLAELNKRLRDLQLLEMGTFGLKAPKNTHLRSNLRKEIARIKTEINKREKENGNTKNRS